MVDPILTPIVIGVAKIATRVVGNWVQARMQIRVEYTRAMLASALEDQRHRNTVNEMIIAQSPGRTSAVIAVDRFGTSGTPALLVSPPPRAAAVTLTENLDRLVLAALADVPTLSTYATVARWEVASGPGPRRVRGQRAPPPDRPLCSLDGRR